MKFIFERCRAIDALRQAQEKSYGYVEHYRKRAATSLLNDWRHRNNQIDGFGWFSRLLVTRPPRIESVEELIEKIDAGEFDRYQSWEINTAIDRLSLSLRERERDVGTVYDALCNAQSMDHIQSIEFDAPLIDAIKRIREWERTHR